MVDKDVAKFAGISASVLAFALVLVYLRKKGIFRSDIRRWSYENPIQNESQEWKYFSTLNKAGMSKFKRNIDQNYLVNL